MKLQYPVIWLLTLALPAAWALEGCKGCNSSRKGNADSSMVVDTVTDFERDTISAWTEQKLIQWKGWIDSSLARPFSADSLQKTLTDTVTSENFSTMDEQQFRDFSPYFIYSPDSTQVVDMVSYGNFLHKGDSGKTVLENGEPDTEVAIVNVQTKKRERILFAGPSTVIKEAAWIDDHTVLIAGGIYDEHNRLIPVLWKYDTHTRLLDNYE